jgi:hypothetical protein
LDRFRFGEKRSFLSRSISAPSCLATIGEIRFSQPAERVSPSTLRRRCVEGKAVHRQFMFIE